MKFKGLKAGDTVFIVRQRDRYEVKNGYPPETLTAVVEKVGRLYGYLRDHVGGGNKFSLETGYSWHPNVNSRVNGFGFDVYTDKAEYLHHAVSVQEHRRLKDRIMKNSWGIIDMPFEYTMAFHNLLDEMESQAD